MGRVRRRSVLAILWRAVRNLRPGRDELRSLRPGVAQALWLLPGIGPGGVGHVCSSRVGDTIVTEQRPRIAHDRKLEG